MNRKLRRTVTSLMRRRKWHVLAEHLTSAQLFRAMDAINAMPNAKRKALR